MKSEERRAGIAHTFLCIFVFFFYLLSSVQCVMNSEGGGIRHSRHFAGASTVTRVVILTSLLSSTLYILL